MKTLYLTVEGQTEEAFVRDSLVQHLAKFNVFVPSPRFTGPHGRRRGRFPRGGMFNTFVHALEDMRRWLKQMRSPDVRFSMMVDLYSLPHNFPGYDAGMKQPSGQGQAESLEQTLAAELGDSRFIPYLQVHEFEALVLTDAARLKYLYEKDHGRIDALVGETATFDTPEEIDHGQHSHPKARIQNAVEKYDENVAGPLIAHDIGLDVLRQRCPHFGQWLTRLEQLDQGGA